MEGSTERRKVDENVELNSASTLGNLPHQVIVGISRTDFQPSPGSVPENSTFSSQYEARPLSSDLKDRPD
jgi:hypothetical protein